MTAVRRTKGDNVVTLRGVKRAFPVTVRRVPVVPSPVMVEVPKALLRPSAAWRRGLPDEWRDLPAATCDVAYAAAQGEWERVTREGDTLIVHNQWVWAWAKPKGDNLVTRSGGVQRTKRVTLKPQSGRAIVRDNLLVLRRQGPWFAKAQTR
jgi:hypothetical protein